MKSFFSFQTLTKTARSSSRQFKKRAVLVAAALSLITPSSYAVDLFWSGDGITEGGAGIWNPTNLNFGISAAGPFDTNWTATSGDNVIFEATGGGVAFGGVTLEGTMFIKTAGYTFPSGTLTLGVGGATNDVADGVTTTITGVIGGAGSLTKNGNGVMILAAVNTYSGGTILNAGTLGWSPNTTTIGLNAPGVKIIIASNDVKFANSGAANKTPQQQVDQLADLICDDSLLVDPGVINFSGAQGPWTLFNGDRTITVNGTARLQIGCLIQEDGTARSLTKSGAGKLTLSNNGNTYSGKTIINGGFLIFGTSDGRLGTPPSSPVSDHLQINGGTLQTTAGVELNPNRGIYLGTNNGTIDVNSGIFTNGAVISGPGGLIRSGVGTSGRILLLTAANTYEGGTTINGGRISIGNNAALSTGTVTVASTGSLSQQIILNTGGLDITNSLVINGNGGVAAQGIVYYEPTAGSATWSGPITINGSASTGGHFASATGGELILAGPVTSSALVTMRNGIVTFANSGNSFSSMSIQGGTCKLGLPNALPVGATVAMGANGAAALDLNDFDQTLAGLTKGAQAANVINSGAATPTLTINNTTAITFSGVLGGSGNSFNLTKAGSESLTLSGDNTYSGTTLISAGALIASNTVGSATGSGAVTVASTGTLGGNGSISGAATINGTVSPGNSVGTLSIGGGILAGAGHYKWEINGAAGTAGTDPGWDVLNIIGTLDITATAGSKFNIDVTSLTLANAPGDASDFNNTSNYVWSIVKTTGGITGFDANAFAINTSGFSNVFGDGSFNITTNATDLLLTFSASTAAQPPTSFVTTAAGQGSFSGSPNTSYTVQFVNNLNPPIIWQTLTNVTTDGAGLGVFNDPSAPNGQPERYYQVKNP